MTAFDVPLTLAPLPPAKEYQPMPYRLLHWAPHRSEAVAAFGGAGSLFAAAVDERTTGIVIGVFALLAGLWPYFKRALQELRGTLREEGIKDANAFGAEIRALSRQIGSLEAKLEDEKNDKAELDHQLKEALAKLDAANAQIAETHRVVVHADKNISQAKLINNELTKETAKKTIENAKKIKKIEAHIASSSDAEIPVTPSE